MSDWQIVLLPRLTQHRHKTTQRPHDPSSYTKKDVCFRVAEHMYVDGTVVYGLDSDAEDTLCHGEDVVRCVFPVGTSHIQCTDTQRRLPSRYQLARVLTNKLACRQHDTRDLNVPQAECLAKFTKAGCTVHTHWQCSKSPQSPAFRPRIKHLDISFTRPTNNTIATR
jgi:hypothetical protein